MPVGITERVLSDNMKTVKLPEFLIEVDNELKIAKHFMPVKQQDYSRPVKLTHYMAYKGVYAYV